MHGVNEVIDNLTKWSMRKRLEAQKVCKTQVAPMLEKRAKADRPWKDRTGNARRGLNAQVEVTTKEIVVQLRHGVEYGIFLELGHAGKYAILKPTLEKSRTDIWRLLNGILK